MHDDIVQPFIAGQMDRYEEVRREGRGRRVERSWNARDPNWTTAVPVMQPHHSMHGEINAISIENTTPGGPIWEADFRGTYPSCDFTRLGPLARVGLLVLRTE